MRVLVVDDNATNRRILDAMLRRWMMLPALAEGGEAGLALMEENAALGQSFPLVLIDAQMPDMDGFMLAERIKQNPRSGRGHGDDADLDGTARRRGPLP